MLLSVLLLAFTGCSRDDAPGSVNPAGEIGTCVPHFYASGSGKSTLLDAFSQLLIPPRWVDFNAAAHETGGKVKGNPMVVYLHSASYATKHGETDAYWLSDQANFSCKVAIEQAGILYGFYTSFLRSPPDFPGSG